MNKVFIETDRLILRAWKEEDLLPFSQLNADPQVMEHFPKLMSLSETESMIKVIHQRQLEHGFCLFATELKTTGDFIGFIGLNIPNYQTPFSPFVEIGWRLAAKFWNQGYATEGALATLKYGFQTLNLKEIVSFTATTNLTSQRVMEKIGMTRDLDGDFEHPSLDKNHRLARHVLYRVQA
jgi:RimJ/RimL family protein N-acetyltransferase